MSTLAPALLTEQEIAIVRSWLGGNGIQGIARARRIPPDEVTKTITQVCGFDRRRGRACLTAGYRIAADAPLKLPPPRPAPTPETPANPAVQTQPAATVRPARPRRARTTAPKPAPTVEPATAEQGIATGEQYRILHAYASGANLTDITRHQRLLLDYVTGVVRALTGMDRKVAGRLVTQYEQANIELPARTTEPAPTAEGISSEALAERAGLTIRQVDYWSRVGWLHPDGGNGSGTSRRFGPEEIRVAVIMARLTAAGIVPEAANRVARGQAELAPGVRVLVDEPAGSPA